MSAVLRVDLDAFARNLAHIRTRIAPSVHMLVVKDDAYGHGLLPIVRRAWTEGVRWFGAFDVGTGIAVREALGQDARIFTWIAASREDVTAAAAHDIDLGVGDADLLADVREVGRRVGRIRVHLKVDSGLRRNGFRPEEWSAALDEALQARARGELDVVGVWSHLAEASDEDDDDAAAVFRAAAAAARDAGLSPFLSHLTASAASFERPELRGDIARVGAFAYGIPARPGEGAVSGGDVRPIATLSAPVQHRDAETVEIGIGSLHGLPSKLAGKVSVTTPAGAQPLLSVGYTTSTVRRWREALVGDEVVLYGEGGATATDLGASIGTIGEEIALRVSPLVPRIWEGEVSGLR